MEFCFEQVINASREVLFAFHANPPNLAVLFRDDPTFRLLHHDGDIRPGCTTWFENTVAWCVPVVMGFRHIAYEPPHRFCDELIHGPYERFMHTHEFEECPEGGLVRDRLDVRLSWQYGGETVLRLVIAPRIRRAFAFRQRALERIVAAGGLRKLAASCP